MGFWQNLGFRKAAFYNAKSVRAYHLLPTKWALEDLARKRLKVSKFTDLNDPFELLSLELSRRAQRDTFAKWRAEKVDAYGVVCFSRTWRSPILWSHYADKHQGICLGFEVAGSSLTRVIYTKKRVPLPKAFTDGGDDPDPGTLDRLFRTKFEHWRYEEELRMVVSLQAADREGQHVFLPFGNDLELTEVVVGPRSSVPKAAIDAALGDISERVVVSKARLAFRRFAVVTNKRGFAVR